MLSFLFLGTNPFTTYAASNRFVDDAGLIGSNVERDLSKRLNDLVETYEIDAVVLTVEDYKTFANSYSSSSPEMFVRSYYENNGFGTDAEKSGIILLISMRERDWQIYIQGEARAAVNNYGFTYISERLVAKMGDGDYEEAIIQYVEDLEKFFEEYDNGTPYGEDHRVKEVKRVALYMGIALLIALLLAFVVVSVLKSQMNTAKPQIAAKAYVKPGSFVLTDQRDLYLYSNTTRTAIPKESSSSSGRSGGSSSGSRGGTGGGGKF